MVQLLAKCPSHGFFASGIELGEGAVATFENNWSTCPRCKQKSPIASGTFSVINGLLNIIKRPDINREDLSVLHRMAIEMASTDLTSDAKSSIAESASTKFGEYFRTLSADQWTLIVAILTMFLTAYATFSPNPTLEEISKKLSQQNQTDQQILFEARRIAADGEQRASQPMLAPKDTQSAHKRVSGKRRKRRSRGHRTA